jgi:hypothetical protein
MLKVNKDTENLEKTEKIRKKKIVKKNYIKLNQTLESFVKPVDRSELEKKRLIVRERHRNIQQHIAEFVINYVFCYSSLDDFLLRIRNIFKFVLGYYNTTHKS